MFRLRNRIFAILFLVVGYTVLKAVELFPSRPWLDAAFGLGIFAFMFVWQWLSHHRRYDFNDRFWYQALMWSGSVVMLIWSTFIPLSLVTDFIYIAMQFAGHDWHSTAFAASHFSLRELEIAVLAVSIAMAFIGFVIAQMGPKVREINVPIGDLPAELQGLKIAQISDLHVGPTIGRRYVEKVVKKTNAVGADVVAITGDLVDGWVDRLTHCLEPLADLHSNHGVFFVTGNHEYYWDAPNLIEKIKQFGLIPLINENVVIEVQKNRLSIAGVTDPAGRLLSHNSSNHNSSKAHDGANVHEPNLDRAATFDGRESDVRVLLAHRPGVYREAEAHGFHLQLSGHTHGGQYFPYNLFIRFFHRFYRGLYRHGRLQVYVNPGTGYWAPASRLGVRAEITVLMLTCGEPQSRA